MRNAQARSDRTCILDILACAAGPFAVCCFTVIIELKGDADDVITLIFEQGGNNAGVNAAGHGDNDACRLMRLRYRREAQGCAHRHYADRAGVWRRKGL